MREYESGRTVCPFCGFDPSAPAQYEDALSPGTVIAGQYTLGIPEKRDGFGFTYIAVDNATDKRVTVREYLPRSCAFRGADGKTVNVTGDAAEYSSKVSGIISEASALSELDYFEAITKIIDCGLENNTAYVITEYLEGETVRDIIDEEGQYSFRNTVADITPVMRALSGIHRAGHIHGAITPDSIMICKNGKIRLTGFGFLSDTDEEPEKGFAPKEQYDSCTGSKESDIYSISAVLYYMLTGNVPADSRHRDTPQDDFIPLCGTADIPPDAEFAIMKGMSVNPEDRPEDAEEILNALLGKKKSFKLNEKLEEPPAPPETPEEEKPKKKLSKAVIIGAVLAAVAGIALLITAIKLLPSIKNQPETTTAVTEITDEDLSTTAPRQEVEILPAEARAKYTEYFRSTEFKERYEKVHAVRIKDIDLYLNSAELPARVRTLDNAKFNEYYYDLDNDGINECIITTDLDGSLRYVTAYIFDIDEERNVFEGGRIEYGEKDTEEIRLCSVRSGDASVYYFLRYTSSVYEDEADKRSFEILSYNGKDMICAASAGNPPADDNSGAAFAYTGIILSADGILWNPASPSMQMSLYPLDKECYVQTPKDYTPIDAPAFDSIWMRNVNSAEEKILIKTSSRMEAYAQVSVIFPGLELDGKDVQLERRTPQGSEIFLYTADGRPIQFVRTIDKRQLAEPYRIEIYYGENRYVSCTVTLDDEENPVYSRPDAELAKLPDVRMMRKDAGVAEIKSHGFTEVYTKTGLSHGLSGLKNVGKVEKIEPAPGDYYPVDTPVTLTIYR